MEPNEQKEPLRKDQPSTAEPSVQQQEVSQPTLAPKKSRKKLIAGIIAAVVVVLLAGAGVFGYMWYQNPEKMVADAFANAAKSESVVFDGSLDVMETEAESGSSFRITLDGRASGNRMEANADVTASNNDEEFNAAGSVIVAGDEGLFAKVNNVREILSTSGMDEETITTLVENLDDTWIKLDADSSEGMTQEFEQQRQCVNNAITSFTQDEAQKKQVGDAYKNNRIFIVEKTGTEAINGVNSHRFTITLDDSKVDGFVAALRETDLVKALNACAETDITEDVAEDLKASSNNAEDTLVEVWVSTWSHEFTQFRVSGTEDQTSLDMVLRTQFNQDVNIETPADATPLKDVMDQIMAAIFSQSMPEGTEVEQDLMLEVQTQ